MEEELKSFWAARKLYGECHGDTEHMLEYWGRVQKRILELHEQATKGVIFNKRKFEEDEQEMIQKRQKLSTRYRKDSKVIRQIPYLPDELLLKVFSYLSVPDLLNVAQVCSRWNLLMQDTSLWAELDFEKYSIHETTAISHILRQPSCKRLKTLKISSVYDSSFTLTFFNEICCLCGPSLTTLSIIDCDGLVFRDPLAFNAIASNCSSLTSIDFSGNSIVHKKGMRELCKKNPNITTLKLNNCDDAWSVLPTIIKHCPNLVRLELRESDFLQDSGYDVFGNLNPRLQTLDIIGSEIELPKLEAIGKLSNLQDLSISIPDIEADFLRILNQMKSLRSLSLEDEEARLSGKLGILTNLQKLKVLHVPSHVFTRKELRELAQNCPNLTTIDFSQSEGVDNYAIQSFASSSPHLESIDVSGCDVSGTGIEAFIACTNLKALNLYYCRNITDSSIEIVARKCRKLESFCLGGGYSSISHVAIHHLTRFCTNLTELDVSQAMSKPYISKAIKYISERCLLLRKLYLNDLGLADKHIKLISQGNRNLNLLDVSRCLLLTDDTLLSTAELPELHVLCLYNNNFTNAGLMALRSRRPYLKVVQSYDRVELK